MIINLFDGEQHLLDNLIFNFHIHFNIIVHSSIRWSYYKLYLLSSALKLKNVFINMLLISPLWGMNINQYTYYTD